MKQPLLKRADKQTSPKPIVKYVKLHGFTVKDGFKFGIGFFLASMVISVVGAVAFAGFMTFIGSLTLMMQGRY